MATARLTVAVSEARPSPSLIVERLKLSSNVGTSLSTTCTLSVALWYPVAEAVRLTVAVCSGTKFSIAWMLNVALAALAAGAAQPLLSAWLLRAICRWRGYRGPDMLAVLGAMVLSLGAACTPAAFDRRWR